MTPNNSTPIDRARQNVEEAWTHWNAADVDALDRARACLERAVGELNSIRETLRSGEAKNGAALRLVLSGLSRDVAGMSRILDSASAFWNGMAWRMNAVAAPSSPEGTEA